MRVFRLWLEGCYDVRMVLVGFGQACSIVSLVDVMSRRGSERVTTFRFSEGELGWARRGAA